MMVQSLQEALAFYEGLPQEKKAAVLGRISFYLTITWRTIIYETGSDCQKDEQIKGINEIQHLILGQMLAYLDERTKRYSDKAVIQILTNRAKNYNLSSAVQHALSKALQFAHNGD